ELARVPQRLQRLQPRVEAEESVEIDCRAVTRSGTSDGDARPRAVVLAFAEWHDDVEAIDGTALKDRNQLFRAAARAGGERGSRQERRREAERHERERALFQEDSSGRHMHLVDSPRAAR